jgi:hypothetical protein
MGGRVISGGVMDVMEKHSPASIKAAVLKLVSEGAVTGPVLRSTLYRTVHGSRFREAFDLAIQGLLESGDIIQTESRNGTHGRLGVSFLPATHE